MNYIWNEDRLRDMVEMCIAGEVVIQKSDNIMEASITFVVK